MSALTKMLEYVLHIDLYVGDLLRAYGMWFYGLLFLVLFAETGLVVTPFLPGDSLLFAAGALVARGEGLGIGWVFLILCAAAILGDSANYWIGHTIGPRLLKNENSKILKKEYLDRTHAFFAHYGNKTIVLGRFVPFVRTFAPFLAGVGEMDYVHFITYNVVGGVAWVALFLFGGFFFGRIPFVEHNLFFVLVAVVVITTIPIVIEYMRQRRISHQATPEADAE
jgi:membrane-associated protein